MEKFSGLIIDASDGKESGYVSPIGNCPHVDTFVKTATKVDTHAPCGICEDKSENWLCITCFNVGCCRFVEGHALSHFEESKHPLSLSFSDLSVWCYECHSYVRSPNLSPIFRLAHQDKFKSEPGKSNIIITTAAPVLAEDTKEIFDDADEVKEKVKQLAELIRNSKHMVAFTGAGVSTSAKIPDYRGPKGVWTLQEKGERAHFEVTMEQALPTPTHMGLVEFGKKGITKFLVSTNVDGLHRRSGITADAMAELHGNCYKELCSSPNCKKEYLRSFDASSHHSNHITGRKCDKCKSPLVDSIINFGENLPTEELNKTVVHSEQCDLSLVLGTSMRVSPANQFPLKAVTNGGKMVIVNLQKTPYDKLASLIIHAPTDTVMQLLFKELEMEIPKYNFEQDLVRSGHQ